MAKLLKLRLGVADDPTAFQPTLNDCLDAMLQQADLLMTDVLGGLMLATAPNGPHRISAFQKPGIKQAIDLLNREGKAVCATFKTELTRIVYEGGGKEQAHTELLRFEDLQLFEDAQLDQSIEVARAQQEVSLAVDDVLPTLDSLVSTLLGWRTIQPGLNPLRPDVFVRALQHTLSVHVPEASVREALIAPSAGLMGVNLRKLYRELCDWLVSSGIEAAVPLGGRVVKGSGASGQAVNDSMAKTLLTLDKLRKLLTGGFDAPPPRPDYLHTVPASMALLQDMKKVDELVKRLEQRPRTAPAPVAETLEEADRQAKATPVLRIGQQLGDEVVRLLFDNLGNDARLLPGLKRQLQLMEGAIHKLAAGDSRFFSDRSHPARQLLDRITQRSLAFQAESDPGWPRFMATVEAAGRWLDSKVVDADTFGELLDHLQGQWNEHDQVLKGRREEAARALLHAEQRNLLAQKLAADFAERVEGLDVAPFVVDFLRNSWPQVVAEAQLSCVDGSDDPFGYGALVEDLIWSVQKTTARRGRTRRLVQMIPGLLAKLKQGLASIDYPPELTQRFFDHLITLHRAAVQEGRDPQLTAAADAAEAEESQIDMTAAEAAMWMAQNEVHDSGYLGEESFLPPEVVEAPDAEPAPPPAPAPKPAVVQAVAPEPDSPKVVAPAPAPAPVQPLGAADLRTGTWVELMLDGQWTRMQLTWASPHGTLFMFTSIAGTAHSMSKRTMERLRADGMIRVVAERNVVDEALDEVAKLALKNSLQDKPPEA